MQLPLYQRNIGHPKSIFFSRHSFDTHGVQRERESTILSVTKNYSFGVNEILREWKIAVVN